MNNKSLAVEYRPRRFDDVVEQSEIVTILRQQISSESVRGAYCFVGAAGTGKTTCARIFANEINEGKGSPIEMDAASNNGVEDVREISKMAQTQPIDGSKYKVFILDEAHMFSANAWAAMLKLIEEPPARCVFILCTTDYWKIPKTIQSRCQRFQFKRISTKGITNRLADIIVSEKVPHADNDAVEYIAKKSDGCMRDALTTLDKCLAYNEELTLDNVIQALGLTSQDTFMSLTDSLASKDVKSILECLEKSYADGVDIKQFIKDYTDFILDVNKYLLTGSFEFVHLPNTKEMSKWLGEYSDNLDYMNQLLTLLVDIGAELRWDSSPLYTVESKFMMWVTK